MNGNKNEGLPPAAEPALPESELPRRIEATIGWKNASEAWGHAVKEKPDGLDIRAKNRLVAAELEIRHIGAELRKVAIDFAAVQQLVDVIEAVPMRAYADETVAYCCLYQSMRLVETLADDVELGPRLGLLQGMRFTLVPDALERMRRLIDGDWLLFNCGKAPVPMAPKRRCAA